MPADNSPATTPLFTKDEWRQLATTLQLSPRQVEILQCLFTGLSDKQMAQELNISFSTVRTHLNHLFKKFGVADRTELVLHVFRCHRAADQQF